MNVIQRKNTEVIEYHHRQYRYTKSYYHYIVLIPKDDYNSNILRFWISSDPISKNMLYKDNLVIPKDEKYLWEYIEELGFKIFVIEDCVRLDFSHWE